MSARLRDGFPLPSVNHLEMLVFKLREDHFELVDGLLPLDIVPHVMAAILVLELLVQILGTEAGPKESSGVINQ